MSSKSLGVIAAAAALALSACAYKETRTENTTLESRTPAASVSAPEATGATGSVEGESSVVSRTETTTTTHSERRGVFARQRPWMR